ncbi:MAG: polysaccharide biosynthesis protein, partial [Anaerolinea sp.]|nr:polysaccharide biosynthesis protein [Anaerolinea sp.]
MDLRSYLSTVYMNSRRVAADISLDVLIVLAVYIALSLITDYRFFAAPELNIAFIFIIALIFIVVLYAFKVYDRLWALSSGHNVVIIINAVAVATVLAIGLGAAVRPRLMSVGFILLASALVLTGFVAVRYRSRLISGGIARLRYYFNPSHRAQFQKARLLIIGAGESGRSLALRIKHGPLSEHYAIVGFIDDDPHKQGRILEGVRVHGGREQIAAVASAYNVDLIAFAIHNISGPDLRAIMTECEKTQARIKVVPDVVNDLLAHTTGAPLRDVQPEDLLGRSVIARHEAVDLSPVLHKRILVTGAAGSIGSELCRQLIDFEPEALVMLDNNESGLFDLTLDLNARCPHLKLIPVLADITNLDNMRTTLAAHRPQIIFHAAAYKHVPMLQNHPTEAVRVNVCGTRNLAELACEFQVERFVLISTDKAVNPSSIMGATKRVCELMLHALSLQSPRTTIFTAVRFGNVLGSRGSVVPIFTRQIERGGPVTVTHPEMTRYFMSIPEAANLIIHAAAITTGDDIYILQMGETVRILDLAERLIRLRGLRPYIDIPIVFSGMRAGEKLHE